MSWFSLKAGWRFTLLAAWIGGHPVWLQLGAYKRLGFAPCAVIHPSAKRGQNATGSEQQCRQTTLFYVQMLQAVCSLWCPAVFLVMGFFLGACCKQQESLLPFITFSLRVNDGAEPSNSVVWPKGYSCMLLMTTSVQGLAHITSKKQIILRKCPLPLMSPPMENRPARPWHLLLLHGRALLTLYTHLEFTCVHVQRRRRLIFSFCGRFFSVACPTIVFRGSWGHSVLLCSVQNHAGLNPWLQSSSNT